MCHNCGQTNINKGQPYQRKTPERGENPSPFGTNRDKFVTPITQASRKKRKEDDADKDKDTIKDVYISEPFNQCADPKHLLKNRKNVDFKDEVLKSCEDLAIDG